MADDKITLRPIVVPRSFDGKQIHFAVVFNFDIPGKNDENIRFPDEFTRWPDTIHQQMKKGVSVGITIGTGGKEQSLPAALANDFDFDVKTAETAWGTIFSFNGTENNASQRRRREGRLVDLFRNASDKGGGPKQEVVTNPIGGSDLRPAQRIESLETPRTRAFLDGSAAHISAVLKADRRELSAVKAHVAQNHAKFVKATAELKPAMTTDAVTKVFSDTAALKAGADTATAAMAKLVAAVSLPQVAAGDEGARIRRSVNQARNRPREAMDSGFAEHPSIAEILARLKHHPGAMERLGLILHCTAQLDPPGSAVSGKISLKLTQVGADLDVADVVTNFDLEPAQGKRFFRASPQVAHASDYASEVWKRFSLLPPEHFNLTQEDHMRTLSRAQLTANSVSSLDDGAAEEALTDAIIIQSQHPSGRTVAGVIHDRLSRVGETRSPKIELYAEDLMSGYAFDVAIDKVVKGGDGKERHEPGQWHPLCRRKIQIAHKDAVLFECEEEGYVSISVGTAAAPIVGPVKTFDEVIVPDDKTTLRMFSLTVDERGAFNTPSDQNQGGGFVVTARKTGSGMIGSLGDLDHPTQLRSILRDTIDISDVSVNTPAPGNAERDRVHLTIGTMPEKGKAQSKEPSWIQELFLSPVFSTEALNESALPRSGVQFFRAESKLRKEEFHFAFTGGVSSFLKADGTVLKADVWPPKFATFEADGERRAYVRSASDVVGKQRLGRAVDPAPVIAVISDSLPQAVLTPNHAAMAGGELTVLTLPFVASDNVTGKGQALKVPATSTFPLRFRFRGQIDDGIVPDTAGGRNGIFFRLKGITTTAPFQCDADLVSDRAGHIVSLAAGDVVSGDGILQSLNGPLKVVQLDFLYKPPSGADAAISADVKAAMDAPNISWLPRIARIEKVLQRVRGPAKAASFEMRGQVIAASPQQYALPPGANSLTGTLVQWQADNDPKKLTTKLILQSGLGPATKGSVVVVSGKVVTARIGAGDEQIFLADQIGILADAGNKGSADDAAISDEARAAKATPRLDWIITVATDDQGDVPARFDASMDPPPVDQPMFHAKDIAAELAKKNQIWIEAVCINEDGKLRGVAWPGWIAGQIAKGSGTLTMLDLRTLQIATVDGAKDRAGYFHLVGPRGSVVVSRLNGDALVSRPLRLVGELVSVEATFPASVKGRPSVYTPTKLSLNLASLTGESRWQIQCDPNARFSDIDPSLPDRRVVDLQPGDCVVAAAWPSSSGVLEIMSTDEDDKHGGKRVNLKAGLVGRWLPASQDESPANLKRLSSISLAEGSIDFLPGSLVTPRGVSRTIWSPRRHQGQPAAPAENALTSHDAIEGTAIRYLPVAFARTIVAHEAQGAAAAAAASAPVVHAVASDAIARWRGWWLTVPQPGRTDLPKGERSPGSWPVEIRSLPPAGHGMLPLRTTNGYWIRGWRVDLAGNTSDRFDDAAKDALKRLPPSACARQLPYFRRPDAPLAPVMAQPGKNIGQPTFALVGYHPSTNQQGREPGSSAQSLRLVLVTDRDGNSIRARKVSNGAAIEDLYFSGCHLLPPPVDVETVLSSGALDPDPKADAAALATHRKRVVKTIGEHEQYLDDNVLGQRSILNYFPDPLATQAIASIAETLGGSVPPVAIQDAARLPSQWLALAKIQLVKSGSWPNAVAPRVDLAAGPVDAKPAGDGLTLQIPPARTGQCRVIARQASDAGADALRDDAGVVAAVTADSGLSIDLIHAVTGPQRQPEWIDLADEPARVQNDTAQNFKSLVNVDVPSSGSIAFSLHWNDLWDETVPALFGPPKVLAYAPNGKITKVEVKDPGFGFGRAAVLKFDEGGGKGAILRPILRDGQLAAVTIEDGGSEYLKDRPFSLIVGRRPPLHTPAIAEAAVSNGKVVAVTLKKGFENNGFYASPPLVVIHDMKGTGREANYKAIIDGEGRIIRFEAVAWIRDPDVGEPGPVKESGRGKEYSDRVVVGVYTDQAQIAEQPIADRDSLDQSAWDSRSFEFSHAFGDTRARHLYMVGQATTRFRDMVAERDRQPMSTEPRRLELVSSARPPKPEIAYLLPAYSSRPPLLKETDRLVEQRDSVIRVYLYRPWNATGDERLGVAVYSAQINTSRIKEDVSSEGLIPQGLRPYVSRWGFDPVWDNVAYSPLTIDDFTNAVDVARYDDVVELDGSELPPVSVALHEVKYSIKKDMWYADIAVRAPEAGLPFVQLALVRYQPHSVPRLSMSEVTLADPIVHPGQRRLIIERPSANAIQVALGGNFDRPTGQPASRLPKRKVVVELRQRIVGLPLDFEGPLAHGDVRIDNQSLDRWELDRASDWKSFAGKVSLSTTVLRKPQDFYLAVKEFEVFSAAASYRDLTGSSGTTFSAGAPSSPVPAYDKLVFYRALGLQELPGG